MPFLLCCPRDGVHSLGPTWQCREDEYVRDLHLHGSATHNRGKMEERESALKESHPLTPVVHALWLVKFCLVVYTCALEDGHALGCGEVGHLGGMVKGGS